MFLMADIVIEVVLVMFFLALSKVEINFVKRQLNWKMYFLNKALQITKQMQIINQKKSAAAALAPNKEAFVMHVAYLRAKILIHPTQETFMALWLVKKVSIPNEYTDFSDVFFKKLATNTF